MANQPEDNFTDNTERYSAGNPGPGADEVEIEYAGFWIRFLASVLDSILLLMVIVPLLLMLYGPGVFFLSESPGLAYNVINYALPIIAVIIFWQYRAATPGKIMMGIYIVDEKTLSQPSFGKLVLRYLGYYVSILTLLLGFIWVAFDKRKQGFHDKIAGTLVVRKITSVDYRNRESETTSTEEPKLQQQEQADPSDDNWNE